MCFHHSVIKIICLLSFEETLVEASASCDVDNGGCSHDCVSLDDGSYACRCPEGYRLDSSLKNCEGS